MIFFTTILVLGLSCGAGFGHGRSEELTNFLNSPVPEWLSLASPIKVEPSLGGAANINKGSFRDKSGGATNSRNRVYIPSKNFVHEFPYKLSWRGGSNEGRGVSLSPDGLRLLTSSGKKPYFRLYDFKDNQLQEIKISLPRITYDEGSKGFIHSWSWASDEVLIGNAEVLDEDGHELVESRLYAFQLNSQSLARLDLSDLNLNKDDPPFVEVVSVGKNLSELVLDIGGNRMLAKADLKSPHKLLDKDATPKRSERVEPPKKEKNPLPSSSSNKTSKEKIEARSVKEESNLPWIIAGVLFVGILALVFKIFKGKSTS